MIYLTMLNNNKTTFVEAVDAVLTDHLSLEHNHTPELQMIPRKFEIIIFVLDMFMHS